MPDDGFAGRPMSALRFIPHALRRTESPPCLEGFTRLDLGLRAKPSGSHLRCVLFAGLILLLLPPAAGFAAEPVVSTPFFSIGIGGAGEEPSRTTVTLQIFLLMTVLSLAPAILIMVTSFTRIVIVLSLLRRALGTMQLPTNQIVIGLALFLTVFIMAPVWQKINQNALQPYLEKKVSSTQALENAAGPLREFMLRQTREKDIALFMEVAKLQRPQGPDDIPLMVVIPAFIISETKTAFEIGLLLYVPFLIIDMVVAAVLLSMGMMMLPPIMVSLPFKLLLFVLADGWYLLVGSLVKSFA
jgi:flagellar biosynthetic protein FliP